MVVIKEKFRNSKKECCKNTEEKRSVSCGNKRKNSNGCGSTVEWILSERQCFGFLIEKDF